jgi:hypothetical protein
VIDRTVAFYASSLLEAVMLLFASYYCFNIQYPECLAATLEFIQSILFYLSVYKKSDFCVPIGLDRNRLLKTFSLM